MGNKIAASPSAAAINTVLEVDLSGKNYTQLPRELKELVASSSPDQPQRPLILSLAFNNLQDIEDLKALSGLKSLDLSRNRVTSFTEAFFHAWPNLESLNLSGNKIVTFVLTTSSIAQAPVRNSLTTINLSNNLLATLPDELGEFLSLRTLNLSFNQLKKLNFTWSHLSALQSLHLENNQVAEITGKFLGCLTSVHQLNLSHNKIRKLPKEIGCLNTITKLYLNNNQLKDLPPEMGQLRQLRELDLRNNSLTDLPSEMSNLWKLTVFDLEENPFPRDEFFQDIPELLAFLAETPRRPPAKKKGLVGSRIKQLQINANEITASPKKQDSTPREFEVQAYRKRLFHVKGKQNILIREVDCKYQSFNQGDVFVLDSGPVVFVWMGQTSNDRERAKGCWFAHKLSEEECGSALVLELDASNQEDSPLFAAGLEFWNQLGGKISIADAEEGGEDDEAEYTWPETNRLFKVTEMGDRLDITVIEDEFLSKEALDHDHCMVLDCYGCTFVWAGSSSTPNEKSWAMLKAEELQSRPRSASVGVYWVMDGDERITFREQFWDWMDDAWEKDIPAVRAAKETKRKLLKAKTMEELLASPGNSAYSSPLQPEKAIHAQHARQPSISSIFPQKRRKIAVSAADEFTEVSKPAVEVPQVVESPKTKKKRKKDRRVKEEVPTIVTPGATQAKITAEKEKKAKQERDRLERERKEQEEQEQLENERREKAERQLQQLQNQQFQQKPPTPQKPLPQSPPQQQPQQIQQSIQKLQQQQQLEQQRLEQQRLEQQRVEQQKVKQQQQQQEQQRQEQLKQQEEETRKQKLKEEIQKKEQQVQLEKEAEKKKEEVKRAAQEKELRDKREREDIDKLEALRREIDAKLDQLKKDFEKRQQAERDRRLAQMKEQRAKAERDRKQRDEREKRELEEKARKEREEKERKEREEQERKEAEERAKKEKQEKDRLEREERERKEKAERDRIAALEANETPTEKRERQRREREEREAKILQEQQQRLENARKEKEEEARKLKEDKERAAKERAEFMAKLEADRKAREERERQERLARRRALEASKTSSHASAGSPPTPDSMDESPASTPAVSARLKGPTRAAGPTRRKAATKNPIRALAARMQAEGESTSAPTSASTPATGARNAAAGGMGLLWSLGADLALWKKKQEDKAARGESTPSGAGKPVRLYHVKGRRNPFVREVEVSWKSINQGDVFVLDDGGSAIYQWNGTEANRIEKGKGLDFAKKLKDKEHAGRPKIVVLESNEIEDDHHFWKLLSKPSDQRVDDSHLGGDDHEAEKRLKDFTTLYIVNPETSSSLDDLELEVVEEYPLMKEMLDTSESYILDCVGEVFPWTGKKSSVPSRNAAVSIAKKMVDSRGFWCAPIKRELEGGESVIFKEKFANWSSTLPIQMKVVASGLNTAPTKKIEKIDATRLHQPPPHKEEVMIDDGSGTPQVWRVEGNQKVAIPSEEFGEFYSGESYIILYKYVFKNKDQYLIYFWQGRDSSINEKGTSALMTIQLDDSIGGVAKEIRVVQNKEPKHFISIFKNRIIIHKGKANNSPGSTRFFQIGEFGQQVKAVEVTPSSAVLNSNNCFVCLTPDTDYVWMGESSSSIEREFASSQTNSALFKKSKKQLVFEEGKEPNEFWKALGKKEDYPIKHRPLKRPKRLFQCSIGTGTFEVHEITGFCQDDLVNDDAMILDAFDEVYVWIGRYAHETEKKLALETAIDYVASLPPPRSAYSVPTLVVQQQLVEPLVFTSHFFGWDNKGQVQTFDEGLDLVEYVAEEYNKHYTYEELRAGLYPKAFDETKLEVYMSDVEFKRVFGMSREEYAQQTSWKREDMKKALALY